MMEIHGLYIKQKIIKKDGKNAKVNKYDSDKNIDHRIIFDTIVGKQNTNIEDLDSFDIQSNMDKENTLENLKNIAKNLPFGFIYITKKYSKIENRYEVYFILNNLSEFLKEEIYIILLTDILDGDKEYLTNIIYGKDSAFLRKELREMKTFKEFCKNNELISRFNVNKVIFE